MVDFRDWFPDLPEDAAQQLTQLAPLYAQWNAAINVISRKDMDSFDVHHVLHSLAIARAMPFAPGSRVLDVGTGGGFPGIPLAIVFPQVEFHLCDSIGKKIKVVSSVAESLHLQNVHCHHGRAESIPGSFDFIVSRAVTRMNRFVPWVERKIASRSLNPWPNGILALKGGDLEAELNEIHQATECLPIAKWFDHPYFETKQVVYVKMQ